MGGSVASFEDTLLSSRGVLPDGTTCSIQKRPPDASRLGIAGRSSARMAEDAHAVLTLWGTQVFSDRPRVDCAHREEWRSQ
jgi:hypothetical protein